MTRQERKELKLKRAAEKAKANGTGGGGEDEEDDDMLANPNRGMFAIRPPPCFTDDNDLSLV
jgi:hypothetical protein